MALKETKLALLLATGLLFAGTAAAAPIMVEPTVDIEMEPNYVDTVLLDSFTVEFGASGEGPATELALQGISVVHQEIVLEMSLPVQAVTNCAAATGCPVTTVPEPGTWLLILTGLLGLVLAQRRIG